VPQCGIVVVLAGWIAAVDDVFCINQQQRRLICISRETVVIPSIACICFIYHHNTHAVFFPSYHTLYRFDRQLLTDSLLSIEGRYR
jgi:hypothetical protein